MQNVEFGRAAEMLSLTLRLAQIAPRGFASNELSVSRITGRSGPRATNAGEGRGEDPQRSSCLFRNGQKIGRSLHGLCS
jgi:hypothetical protein